MCKHQGYKKNSIRILPWHDVMRSMFWEVLVVCILAASCTHFGYLEEFWKEVTLCSSTPVGSIAIHGENFGWTHVWVCVNGHDFGGFDCCNLGSCCDAVVR